jgi:ubiquinone/menaquinone biosynthesis C-methylase UbiE
VTIRTIKVLHGLLSIPILFELQQRIFNDYSKVRMEFEEFLGQSGVSILDIGCSTGACAASIVSMESNSYVGLDIEADYVALAARRAPAGRFVAMDARVMAFPDATFDLAMFIGVMHHMDDTLVKDCLRDVARVLKPAGRVLVAEPVFTPGSWLSTTLLNMDRGRYIRNEAGYRGLFEGFSVDRQRYFRFSLHRFCSFVLSPSLH